MISLFDALCQHDECLAVFDCPWGNLGFAVESNDITGFTTDPLVVECQF